MNFYFCLHILLTLLRNNKISYKYVWFLMRCFVIHLVGTFGKKRWFTYILIYFTCVDNIHVTNFVVTVFFVFVFFCCLILILCSGRDIYIYFLKKKKMSMSWFSFMGRIHKTIYLIKYNETPCTQVCTMSIKNNVVKKKSMTRFHVINFGNPTSKKMFCVF